jgi:hypothetical protein
MNTMRLLYVIFLLSSLISNDLFAQKKTVKKEDVFGCWIVQNRIDLPISSMDEEETVAISKERFCIGKKYITIFGEDIYDPKFKITLVNVDKYLYSHNGLNKKGLNIKSDSVYLVEIFSEKQINNQPTLYREADFLYDLKKLYVNKEGTYFIMRRK